MINREDIAWLDGYLKGLTALQKEVGHFKFNILLINLKGGDVVQSYLEFINSNDEAESLGVNFFPLKLESCEPIYNWSEVVANNIGSIFYRMENESYQEAIYQVLDVLDMVVPELNTNKNFRCTAQIGKYTGEYLFLQLTGDEYLVLSFLHH